MKNTVSGKQNNIDIIPYLNGEITDLTDGDSNEVYAVDNRYIVKKYFSQKLLMQETAGYLLFNSLTTFGVPMVLDKGNDYLVLEYIDADSCFMLFHKKNTLTMQQAAQKAALFIAEVYWNYRFTAKNKITLFKGIAWMERYSDILAKSFQYSQSFNSSLQPTQILLIQQAQKDMKQLQVDNKALTLLHRDLHLDNILVKRNATGRNGNFVIDFEHCMEGPIELEMQNSLFWNDAWSISAELIREELIKKHDIPYSIEREKELLCVYLLDQVNIAYEKGDTEKMSLLLKTYNQRLQERIC